MSLVKYINRHAGETAWLFGKGPSLSTFDFKEAGPLRVAINDVIAHVPDCVYGFANDGVAKWADVYRKGQTLFQPSRCLHEYDSTKPNAVACDVVQYYDTCDDTRLAWQREKLANEGLTIRRGTLGSALQILFIMGVRSVYMVGIDGGGTHALGYEWRTRLRNDHQADYNAIRNSAIDTAWIMGIGLRFHNHDHNMEPNGKVLVKFIRNSMVKALPYALGEVASFTPNVAQDLITCRAAERFTPIANPIPELEIETAVAPMQARESAIIKTRKGKRY